MRQSIKDIFRWFPIRVYGKVILEHEAIVKPAENQCEIFGSTILVPKINEADVSQGEEISRYFLRLREKNRDFALQLILCEEFLYIHQILQSFFKDNVIFIF